MSGVHVHVAVSRDQAIPVADAMQGFLPLLIAVAANSSVKQGGDAHASWRARVWGHQLSTVGYPCRFGSWDGFVAQTSRMQQSGLIASQKDLYSFIRPTRYGTLEYRCFDVPPSLESLAGLVALTQSLVVYVQQNPEFQIPVELQHPNMIQAVTYGRNARLFDPDGQRRPVSEILDDLLVRVEPVASELGCWNELQQIARTEVIVPDTRAATSRPTPVRLAQLTTLAAAIALPLMSFT